MATFADYVIAFFMSMMPIVELRGGLIYAATNNIPFIDAFIICFIGNILPIPFILLFIRRIFRFLERFKYTKDIVKKIERKVRTKEESVKRHQLLGLFILVAIPLPGTGAWTGALLADLFDIQIKKAFPAIALGVLVAGIIMSVLSFWLPDLFFNIR